MVKVEDIETMGWRKAIKGMRNAMNSWDRMDSVFGTYWGEIDGHKCIDTDGFVLGPNDLDLACRLIKAGPEHRKFLRMIHIQMDITAPLYWWKEMDTYKVATVANSCSTMHKIHSKEFEVDDFSCEHMYQETLDLFENNIHHLNKVRDIYLNGGVLRVGQAPAWFKAKDKEIWWQMIQLLPSSYNQLRTWDGTMETVLSIIHQRLHHKLDTDWGPFCQSCFDNIPYCKEFYEALYDKEENKK